MIPGVILAAGRSIRMGQPKALLLCPSGDTFIRQLACALQQGGVQEVLVVGRVDDDGLRAEVDAFPVAARYVANPGADGGQLTSVLAGLSVADRPGVSGLLVTPVDAPMITPATIASLLQAFRSTHAPIIRARYEGRHGHPVIFARAVFGDLRRADPSVGARAVVRANSGRVVEVDVDDPGVLGDIDTPDDYDALRGQKGTI